MLVLTNRCTSCSFLFVDNFSRLPRLKYYYGLSTCGCARVKAAGFTSIAFALVYRLITVEPDWSGPVILATTYQIPGICFTELLLISSGMRVRHQRVWVGVWRIFWLECMWTLEEGFSLKKKQHEVRTGYDVCRQISLSRAWLNGFQMLK